MRPRRLFNELPAPYEAPPTVYQNVPFYGSLKRQPGRTKRATPAQRYHLKR